MYDVIMSSCGRRMGPTPSTLKQKCTVKNHHHHHHLCARKTSGKTQYVHQWNSESLI